MNKIIKTIPNTLLIIAIIILSIYLVLKYTNNIGIYKVVTGSMEPNIHVGDYLLVKKCSKYKENDIITFKKDGYYITHRIVEIKEKTVITKGDANNINDDEINKSDIVGKYIFKHKILNYIIEYKYLIFGTIVIIFVSGELLKRKWIRYEEKNNITINNTFLLCYLHYLLII